MNTFSYIEYKNFSISNYNLQDILESFASVFSSIWCFLSVFTGVVGVLHI